MIYECLSCNGVYETPQGDMEYFHTCPKAKLVMKGQAGWLPTRKDQAGNVIPYQKIPIVNPRDERAPRDLHSVQEGEVKHWYLGKDLVITLQKDLKPDIFTKEGKGRKVVASL